MAGAGFDYDLGQPLDRCRRCRTRWICTAQLPHREGPSPVVTSVAKRRRKAQRRNCSRNARQPTPYGETKRETFTKSAVCAGACRRKSKFRRFSNGVPFLCKAIFVELLELKPHESGRLPPRLCYLKSDLFIDSHSVSWVLPGHENGITLLRYSPRGISCKFDPNL